MASPVFTPGGQCSVRKPHNSTIPADAVLKLEIQHVVVAIDGSGPRAQ